MKSVISKYMSYEPYAAKIGHAAYNIGLKIAERAIKDGKNPYEVMYVLIDNIVSGFATARARHSIKVRAEENNVPTKSE